MHEQLFKRSLHNRQRWITVDVFFVYVRARCVSISLCVLALAGRCCSDFITQNSICTLISVSWCVYVCVNYMAKHTAISCDIKKVKLLAFANCKQRNVYMIESLMGSKRKHTHTFTHTQRERREWGAHESQQTPNTIQKRWKMKTKWNKRRKEKINIKDAYTRRANGTTQNIIIPKNFMEKESASKAKHLKMVYTERTYTVDS